MNSIKSTTPPKLDSCHADLDFRQYILEYFKNAWEIEDLLMHSLVGEETFYSKPDPLRNPLIFYLGHTAVFYINKLVFVGLLEKPINFNYERLFELGVDPKKSEELDQAIAHINWPQLEDVWQYRKKVYQSVISLIEKTPLNLPIHQDHPLWALMMGIEHQRIHIETSSMLFRQLPTEKLRRPSNWQYAPTNGEVVENEMIEVSGGVVKLGKPEDDPTYGWDIEYGDRQVKVAPFVASKYLITNAEFLEFVKGGGYENQDYWTQESWHWKNENNIKHPKFWIPENGTSIYRYRAMFDAINLPLNWPVEVNHYEAMAYCSWRGKNTRLMSEAEYNLATYGNGRKVEVDNYNLNLKFGSPTPVGLLETAKNESGLYDLRGNVWEWLSDNLNPLSGYKTHQLYENYSAPFFNSRYNMMLGGCWITSGTEAFKYYRNWFRPNFYQHVGFRIVQG